ncbi:MAG TPA: hypothetical protein VM324_10530 [Egibacteraceae bacterium]|nr:hypothetical protein [Egibacteraceae bacterium]
MVLIAGFDGPGFTSLLLLVLTGAAIVWSAPAGLAGAVAGAHLARRRVAGWCAGWCLGAAAAGSLALLASRAGVYGWELNALAYAPVWAACAALVAWRRATAR